MNRFWTKYYDNKVPSDFTEKILLTELMEKKLLEGSDLTAFSNFGVSMTYEHLNEESYRLSKILRKYFPEQTPIGIMLPNLLQYPVILLAILRANCIVVNINPLYSPREMLHQLSDSKCKALFIFEGQCNVLEKIYQDYPLEKVIICKLGDYLGFKGLFYNFFYKIVPYYLPGSVFYSKFRKEEASSFSRSINPDSIAFLQYTGGTTGVAKGAILTQHSVGSNVMQSIYWSKSTLEEKKEVMVTPLPLYHIFSLTANCLFFIGMLGKNILITNPRDLKSFLKILKKNSFTVLTGVSTLFKNLLHHKDFQVSYFSTCKFVLAGGMSLDKTLASDWKKTTNIPLIEGYGLTECSPIVSCQSFSAKEHDESVGYPYPGTDISILDENDKELEIGELGEICVYGPQLMKGYWNKPEETQHVFTSKGYLRTGDMGYLSEEGTLKIVDRKKDVIISSGFKIFPTEIEQLFLTQKEVLECALVGRPSEKTGEEPVLFLKLKSAWTKEEILLFAHKNLTSYKIPKDIFIVEEFPKSNVGKILKKDLKKLYLK